MFLSYVDAEIERKLPKHNISKNESSSSLDYGLPWDGNAKNQGIRLINSQL
jgi:hypothetical protein